MVLNHPSILLLEFIRHIAALEALAAVVGRKLDSSLASIALDCVRGHSLRQLRAHASVVVHQIEVGLVSTASFGRACNFIGMMGLLQDTLSTVPYFKFRII